MSCPPKPSIPPHPTRRAILRVELPARPEALEAVNVRAAGIRRGDPPPITPNPSFRPPIRNLESLPTTNVMPPKTLRSPAPNPPRILRQRLPVRPEALEG